MRPHLTVRVFDEPEAHLHPAAQRQIATALERLRLRGDHVVITSHGPHFLGVPGWRLVHAQTTAEGSTLSVLSPEDLDARKALAGQMGLTRGELLAHIAYRGSGKPRLVYPGARRFSEWARIGTLTSW